MAKVAQSYLIIVERSHNHSELILKVFAAENHSRAFGSAADARVRLSISDGMNESG